MDTLELVDTGTQPRRSSCPKLPAAGRPESELSPPASFSKKRILYVYFGSLGGGGGGQEVAAAAGSGHYIHVCQPGHRCHAAAAMCRYNGSIFHEKRRAWNGLHPLQF